MNPRALVHCSLLTTSLLIASRAGAAEHVIDDFESAGAPAPWVFYDGAEFPGAKGSLASSPGHEGKGARLSYDLSGGGQYVAASLSLDTPVAAKALAVWIKSPPAIRVTLRVVDDTGQTLQLPAQRPLYAWDSAAWYRVVVPVTESSQHWGGADDGVLHGSVHSMSVLAADPYEPGAVGAVDFDEVMWLDEVAFALDPATMVRAPVPAGAARLRDRLGANIHFTSDDKALDALRDAGFRWVRMDLFWSTVEHQGAYDFSAYDGLVNALESRDMQAHFILCYGHEDHASGPGWAPQTDAEVEAFGDYAQAAAEHFAAKPVQFEVWNEANIEAFWKPAPDVTRYTALAKEAVHRVHLGNPSALVSTTGTAGVDLEFLRDCLAQGCADEADAVGVHPYRQGGPESAGQEILRLREFIAAAVPANPPVWQTEWGYSSTWYGDGHAQESRERQGVLAVREALTSWGLGFPLAVYYDTRDDGTDPTEKEHNFGLLTHEYGDKPAMVALRTLSGFAADRSLSAFGVASPSSLHVMELEGAADRVYVLWSSAEGTPVPVRLPAGASVRSAMGDALTPDTEGGVASVMIDERSGPVYVVVPKPVEADAGTPAEAGAEAAADASEASVPDGSVGDAASGEAGSGGEGVEDDGGCGCETVGERGRGSAGWIAALGVALARWRRRRG